MNAICHGVLLSTISRAALEALDHDPEFLVIGPAPSSASLDHFKPFNLSTVLIAVHKDSYAPLRLTQQGALTGGRR